MTKSQEYYQANKEKILERNRQYRKKTKYHLKRDKTKQAGYVRKSQKKHAARVYRYHKSWRSRKISDKILRELTVYEILDYERNTDNNFYSNIFNP